MHIDGIEGLDIEDRTFHWRSIEYSYSQVTGIYFTATITSHSLNGIPTGKSYEAALSINLDREILRIEPKKGWFGKLKVDGMQALQRANAILSQVTFNYRIVPYEDQFEKAGFFEYSGVQFHKDGHIFRGGQEVGSVQKDADLSFHLSPFKLTLVRKTEGFAQKLVKAFVKNDIVIDLTLNRDCMIYMLKRVYGVAWKGEFIPEKYVDREYLFYETVVRFGAILSKVDGNADPSELMQLKRFFSINDQKLPDAARIFNEALHISLTLDEVLAPFAMEFEAAAELKESFLIGMLSVALADGIFAQSEYHLIQRAALHLGLSKADFERLLATVGISHAEFGPSGKKSGSNPPNQSRTSHRTTHLRILGLDDNADQQAIRVAYRTLVRRYHPDILKGQGMPDAEIAKAQTILVKINLAYEALMSGKA